MPQKVPVIVVSGFLGSGKTTFLRYLINKSNKKFGFLINEFGDVGIDGDLIKSCSNCDESIDKKIIMLNNGCVCCTVQDDFIPSIKSLLGSSLEIDTIIVETSGLALPLPLLKALSWPEIKASIYLDLVVCIVNGEAMIDGSPINDLSLIKNQYKDTKVIEHNSSLDELFQEQLETSDVILISRADLLNQYQYKKVEDNIKLKINNDIPIMKCFNGEINLKYFFGSEIKKNIYKDSFENDKEENHNHSHPKIYSRLLKSSYFLNKKDFEKQMVVILEDLNILRIKGRVWIPSKNLPLQVQIVGKKINTWFEEAPNNCWRPNGDIGMELILIGPDEKSFCKLEKKIKEKFNILDDPKSGK